LIKRNHDARRDVLRFAGASVFGFALSGPCRFQFRKRTRGRYENDADNQNSRHRDHQSRF
jgi:hypothetical protein